MRMTYASYGVRRADRFSIYYSYIDVNGGHIIFFLYGLLGRVIYCDNSIRDARNCCRRKAKTQERNNSQETNDPQKVS